MRGSVYLLVGMLLLTVPALARAQSDIPPPVVKSLNDPEIADPYSPWLGAVAGTTVAVVGVNIWTGGALLTPAVGPALSGLLGGAWIGPAAMMPLAAQSLFQTTTLFATGLVGGGLGYWMMGE